MKIYTLSLFLGSFVLSSSSCSLNAQLEHQPVPMIGQPLVVPPPRQSPLRLPQEESAPFSTQQLPPVPSNLPERASEILNFWFGFLPYPDFFPQDKMSVWFKDTPEIDRQMRESFAQDVEKAIRGEYNQWRETPKGRLALILLLDQFSRHLYHNRPQAFLSDPMARGLVLEGMKKGDDQQLYPIEKAFFYLPLEHAEDPAMQALSVESYQRLMLQSPPAIKPVIQEFLQSALMHQQVIARFGRFPHRNRILNRESTPEEIVFLSQRGGFAPF